MKPTVKLETIIRTVCLVVALVNQGLTMAGHSLLPITSDHLFLSLSSPCCPPKKRVTSVGSFFLVHPLPLLALFSLLGELF